MKYLSSKPFSTGPASKEYRDNWDNTFRDKRADEKGGRGFFEGCPSPTGEHFLTFDGTHCRLCGAKPPGEAHPACECNSCILGTPCT